MSVHRRRVPLKWSNGERTIALAAGAATVSETFLYDGNSAGTEGIFKASLAGAATDGDTVAFFLQLSAGDPDGNGDNELASSDTVNPIQIGLVDLNASDPGLSYGEGPASLEGRIYVVNNAGATVTVSVGLQLRNE